MRFSGSSDGNRTRVSALRGRRPRPLDYGAMKLAGEEGFEPSQSDPESDVLPLDDSPTDAMSTADYSRGLHVCKGLELPKLPTCPACYDKAKRQTEASMGLASVLHCHPGQGFWPQ